MNAALSIDGRPDGPRAADAAPGVPPAVPPSAALAPEA
jgi:hypothetical protein